MASAMLNEITTRVVAKCNKESHPLTGGVWTPVGDAQLRVSLLKALNHVSTDVISFINAATQRDDVKWWKAIHGMLAVALAAESTRVVKEYITLDEASRGIERVSIYVKLCLDKTIPDARFVVCSTPVKEIVGHTFSCLWNA